MQKCALSIILGDRYVDYEQATKALFIEKLSERRLKLCENFAKKAAKSLKFQNWFCEIKMKENRYSTRAKNNKFKPKYEEIPTRTVRYRKSPLPYLIDILNKLN